MKRNLLITALLFLGLAAIYLLFNPAKPPPTMVDGSADRPDARQAERLTPKPPGDAPSGPSGKREASSSDRIPPGKPAANLATRAGELLPEPDPSAALPPETVLQNLRRAVRQFGEVFGGNPVGTNPEITRQLRGDNPKGINFINAQPGMAINGKGELVDAWETPYFFHQVSGTEMEIHSAGPDKVLWTSDDLVVR